MRKTERVPAAEMGTLKVCQSCLEWMQGVPDGSLEFLMVFLLGTPDIEVVSESKCRARIKCRYRWGRWKLDTSPPVSLNIYPFSQSDTPYYITLNEMNNSDNSVLSWSEHLRGKTWITPVDIFDFHKACAALKERGFIKSEKGRQNERTF